MTDNEIVATVREAITPHVMEPADVTGRRKTADAIRSAGVALIDGDDGVALSRDYRIVVCLADGRKLVVYPELEGMGLKWLPGIEIIPTTASEE